MNPRNLLLCILALPLTFAQAADKPKITLNEFFNAVDFPAVKISPDGHSVVIAAERSDWEQNIFAENLWLYRDDGRNPGSLTQLTRSGHDSEPQWSPDGRWIAFLSERKLPKGKDQSSDDDSDEDVSNLYLISPDGGEAFAVTEGDETVHAFAWAADSRSLYFATRAPWTKDAEGCLQERMEGRAAIPRF